MMRGKGGGGGGVGGGEGEAEVTNATLLLNFFVPSAK